MANLDPLVSRTASLGKAVHVSNPPGYSKVFSIWTSSAVIAATAVLPIQIKSYASASINLYI
jgi:hypothetical protein